MAAVAEKEAAGKAAGLKKKKAAAATVIQAAWRACEAVWQYHTDWQLAEDARMAEEAEEAEAIRKDDFAFGNPDFVSTPADPSTDESVNSDTSDVEDVVRRVPDVTAGTWFVLHHPEQQDAPLSQQSAEILVKDYKDNYGTGRPAPAFYKHRFHARSGQQVVVAADWYRHMDDLGENEVPVLVTSCNEYGDLYDMTGQPHEPDRCDEGFYVTRANLAGLPATDAPLKKRINIDHLSDVSDEDPEDEEELD